MRLGSQILIRTPTTLRKARQALTQQLHMERKVREQAKQDELNVSLKKQVDEKRALLKQQRHDDLFSVNPSPERAYPMEQRLNLALEQKLKRTLKSALDEQVQTQKPQACPCFAQPILPPP